MITIRVTVFNDKNLKIIPLERKPSFLENCKRTGYYSISPCQFALKLHSILFDQFQDYVTRNFVIFYYHNSKRAKNTRKKLEHRPMKRNWTTVQQLYAECHGVMPEDEFEL